MADETYNGWPTYETWAVNVHIGDLLYEIGFEHMHVNGIVDAVELGKFLSSWFDEHVVEPANIDGLLKDLLRTDRIRWYSLAEHIIDDYESNTLYMVVDGKGE